MLEYFPPLRGVNLAAKTVTARHSPQTLLGLIANFGEDQRAVVPKTKVGAVAIVTRCRVAIVNAEFGVSLFRRLNPRNRAPNTPPDKP